MPAVQRAKTTAATPETVWATLQEFSTNFSASMEKLRERQEETARQMQKTDERIKLFTEQFGDLSNKFGTMTEHLVALGIVEKFNSLGYHFNGQSGDTMKMDIPKGFKPKEW